MLRPKQIHNHQTYTHMAPPEKTVRVYLDEYTHPDHPDKPVILEILINEEKLGKEIAKLKKHLLTHTRDIPSTAISGKKVSLK